MEDFKLSASLSGHDDDVRAVTFPDPKLVISASRDATIRLWRCIPSSPPEFENTISSYGTAFINAVAYMPPSTAFPEGLIISGGNDSIIEVRAPSRAPAENAEALLLGHSNTVCSLAVDASGSFIVSGGWDGQGILWRVGKWESETIFQGHEGSVWAVLAYDSETVVTGCADKTIRIFHTSGKLLRSIRTAEVIRALCKVPKVHPSGADLASASNDGMIRLWTKDGRMVGELFGHENFIYSLSSLPTGELVSSGEDRTLRIWRGAQCVQTIVHPAISVWSVAVCSENGDVVTGASDKVARIFSRSPERFGSAETISQFEDSVKASSIPQQQIGSLNKEKLPGPEFLKQKSGTKEGQVQMIREDDGTVTAHMWSVGSQNWSNIGAVVNAVGSSGKKVDYLGKEYDYVFDVDTQEGAPALKLPYNLSQNPYEAAKKFVHENELPVTYLDQVANFIIQNTQGATIGQTQQYEETTTTPTSRPEAPKIIPQTSYLSIVNGRFDGIQKKIEELNSSLLTEGQKGISLNPSEINGLKSVLQTLSSSPISKNEISIKYGLDIGIKMITTWPYGSRLAALDLIRLIAICPVAAEYRHSSDGSNLISVLTRSVKENDIPSDNHVMMAVRAFVNLFETPEGRKLVLSEFDLIKDFLKVSATSSRNSAVAISTLYINFAVLFATSEEPSLTQVATLLDELSTFMEFQGDSESAYRGLVALGTFMGVSEEFKDSAKEVYKFPRIVSTVSNKLKEPRIRNVVAEINAQWV